MAGRNTLLVNIHTKKYIQAVFEESLRAAGFANQGLFGPLRNVSLF